ncbi:MAG: hypothetical protein ACYC56_00645 [Candidatus Aquicultor sp.]
MDGISLFYSVFTYLAFAIFLMGSMTKIWKYAVTQTPLKIPLTSAPVGGTGVVYTGYAIHLGLALALIKHLRFFFATTNAALNWFTTFEVYAGFERIA